MARTGINLTDQYDVLNADAGVKVRYGVYWGDPAFPKGPQPVWHYGFREDVPPDADVDRSKFRSLPETVVTIVGRVGQLVPTAPLMQNINDIGKVGDRISSLRFICWEYVGISGPAHERLITAVRAALGV